MHVESDEPEDSQQVHKVRYLKHRESGCIITSQFKAWNDTVRMAMYIDLILKPLAEKQGGKFFLWMDNVSSHKVDLLHWRPFLRKLMLKWDTFHLT